MSLKGIPENWVDYPDILNTPLTKRTKFPKEDSPITPLRRKQQRIPETSVRLSNHQPQNYPVEYIDFSRDSSLQFLSTEQRDLIELFLFQKGSQAITRSIQRSQNLNRERGSLPFNEGELIGQATGIAFERLAHLWLSRQKTKEDELLLDLGSSTRVSGALSRASGIYLHPDGMLFSKIFTSPTLEGVFEYKSNLRLLEVQESLTQQIINIQRFFERAKGKSFSVYVAADTVKNIRFNQIILAKNPEITLVIPQDRRIPTNFDPNIKVLRVPLDSSVVAYVATECLKPVLPTLLKIS